MQDSLEDYIRLSNNGKADDLKLSKDAVLAAKVKKECEKRAMKIVEFAIEGKLRSEIFLKCLSFINQDHYQDIVEERSIGKLCGYAVCGKRLPEMPKKQYFISTKSNKVYDITDRKNYCSNFCYKASLHIKTQIDNSPLWLRKVEDVPDYKLLKSGEGGLPGEYIDQGLSKPSTEVPIFTTISTFTEASLEDMVRREISTQKTTQKQSYRKKVAQSKMQTISENSEPPEEDLEQELEVKKVPELPNTNCVKLAKSDSNKQIHTLPVIDENEERNEKENEELVKKTKINKKRKDKSTKIDIEAHILKSVQEWLTLDSYIFIYGESTIKNILSERKLQDMFQNLHIEEMDQQQQTKYMSICKRLHLQEMADDQFDRNLIGGQKLKPIPDYSLLKKEGKELDLKVKAYLSGQLYEKDDPNFPQKGTKTMEGEEDQGPPAVLPLVDVSSQNALRRKIFLNSINKAMQVLLQALRVTSYSAVLSDLQTLVKTFKLTATNIVFKPVLWNYISVILFNILCLRDAELNQICNEQRSKDHFDLILNSLPTRTKFLHDTLSKIKDVDRFIERFIVCKEL